jgi:hypothetical protein
MVQKITHSPDTDIFKFAGPAFPDTLDGSNGQPEQLMEEMA